MGFKKLNGVKNLPAIQRCRFNPWWKIPGRAATLRDSCRPVRGAWYLIGRSREESDMVSTHCLKILKIFFSKYKTDYILEICDYLMNIHSKIFQV